MATSMVKEIYSLQKRYNLDIRLLFHDALKSISKLFSQNVEGIYEVMHQRIRDEIL